MISGGIEVKLHKYTNTLNIRSENCRQFLKNGFKFCFTPLRSASKMLYQNCKLAVYNLIKRGSAITFLRDWCRHYYRYLEAVIYRRCSIQNSYSENCRKIDRISNFHKKCTPSELFSCELYKFLSHFSVENIQVTASKYLHCIITNINKQLTLRSQIVIIDQ